MGIAFDLSGLRLLPAGIVADAVDHVVDLTVGHALAA